MPVTASFLSATYSKSLNNWGVLTQRQGHLADAGEWFRRSLDLNPQNVCAHINLDFNEHYQRGEKLRLNPAAVQKEYADIFGRQSDWREVLSDFGPVDEPTYLFRCMRILGGCDIVIGVTSASPIRVLAVDDHPLIRAGVVAFLATEPDLQVVAEAANGEEALEQYRELRPDIVLMDLSMPVMDGLSATRAILDEFPDASVIVLTTYDGDEDIHRALEAGARGYLLKDMVAADVLNVIRTVHGGRRGIPHAVAAKVRYVGALSRKLDNDPAAQKNSQG